LELFSDARYTIEEFNRALDEAKARETKKTMVGLVELP